MKYKHTGYNRLLVGDLYHWEANNKGNLLVEENQKAVGSV